MRRVAAIDIGTNTIRLLVAELTTQDSYEVLFESGEITRLGEGLARGGPVKKEAIERSLKCLKKMVDDAKNLGVSELMACATSALREAANRDEFLSLVRQEMGLTIDVISGEKEALLTVRGVFKGLKLPDKETAIFDLGGGSTEFIFTSGYKIHDLRSLSLGVVALAEEYLTSFPTLPENLVAMKTQIVKQLKGFNSGRLTLPRKDPGRSEILIGTGGSATTLAGIDLRLHQYDAKKINGHILKLDRVKDIFEFLIRRSPEERQTIPLIEKGREDIIPAGAAIIVEIMKTFNQDRVVISHSGLKEGMMAGMCASL